MSIPSGDGSAQFCMVNSRGTASPFLSAGLGCIHENEKTVREIFVPGIEMGAPALLYSCPRWYLVRPLHKRYAPPQATKVFQRYRLYHDESPGGMGEKARSTAEEFGRQAKEKAESTSKAAEKAWDDFTHVVSATGNSETEPEKAEEKSKDKVEKGNYDEMGKD
ncbi:hypothetical protein ACLOJK_000824 [Asimina triloba]